MNIAQPPPRRRHQWGEPNVALYKTERECRACGLVKVAHHDDPRRAWVSWHRADGVEVERMPECLPAMAEASA